MQDELATQRSATLRFRREVEDRFGVLPNFFCTAEAAPGLLEELWKFAKSAYLDSPLPPLFKERLFVQLSRFCEIRYCIVRHVGFLIGQGRPAGDVEAVPETLEQVLELLKHPLPEGSALASALDRLEGMSPAAPLPEPRTQAERDLFDALTIMFLAPREAARARDAVRAAVGEANFELLVAYLAFIRTAHYWTENHPDLAYEDDMANLLHLHSDLADLLLDTSEAEFAHGGLRLRETLDHLKRVEVALEESESRHAFLLRLGDALRPIDDPKLIQDEASRLLCDRLEADRVSYGDTYEPQLVASRTGGFYAAPLFRNGQLVAALSVTSLLPRTWTPDEVELIRETAERTWDAVERARAEEQLRTADVRKDEFLAMLAHELRNPLAPIRTGLELIRRGGDNVVAVEQVRAMMERQVGHMVRLIDDLLDVSRITSGKIALQREPTPLSSLVQSAIEANRGALGDKHIALTVDMPQDEWIIDVDPTRFVQILSNLLHNAAKFTSPGGSVRISADVSQPEGGGLPHVSIAVSDSGIGISPEFLPRVFELFSQGEGSGLHSGLGIGLALARRLVELHGGSLDATSDGAGRGSEFVLELPLTMPLLVPAGQGRADDRRFARKVLVIDDNQDAADTTAMLLADMGADPRVAYSGELALEMLDEYKPEVILLDIGMRGIDGYETCRRLRVMLGSGVVIVALTGFGQVQDKEKAMRAGFDAHLTKPADEVALAGVLARKSG